ncbi:MAG: methyl-accepting chemotaxis protein, partial [Solidesulfovibrio magneticus str. Maddingley MBC34]
EAGRGFAVVADEVRKLAEKTMAATAEVGQAVRDIQAGARQSVSGVGEAVAAIESANQLAGESGQALSAIVGLVETASDQVRSIAAAAQQQSAASDSIEAAVAAVGTVSKDTADAMEQAAQSLAELSEQARIIEALIEELRGEGNLTALSS